MSLESLPAQAARRVVFVENGIGFGGALICLLHLVENLDRSRFDPVVITARADPPYPQIAQYASWEVVPDRLLDLQPAKKRVAASTWLSRIPGARRIATWLLARADDVINLVPYVWRLSRRLRALDADLVHANNEPLCNRGALIAARWVGLPVVCHVRGDQQGSRMMRTLFRLPDLLIPVSRWIESSVAGMGVPRERINFIYDGIDFGRLDQNADGRRFRRAHGIPADAFLIGLVGMLIPWKGQRLFLEAVRLIRDKVPRLHVALVGGTPEDCQGYESELRDLIARAGLAPICTLTGHVPQMSEAYAALDVVVTASVDPEPLGIVMVEAMALGRPLAAPAHGGSLELIQDGRTGLLFRPNDAASLASVLLSLHAEPALRAALGSAAAAEVRTQFSVHHSARAVERAYEQILQRQRPHRS